MKKLYVASLFLIFTCTYVSAQSLPQESPDTVGIPLQDIPQVSPTQPEPQPGSQYQRVYYYTTPQQKMRSSKLGISLGYSVNTINQLYKENGEQYRGKTGSIGGLRAGLMFEQRFNYSSAFAIGLMYARKGVKDKDDIGARVLLDYIEIPCLYREYLGNNRRFFVDMGLTFDILTSGGIKVNDTKVGASELFSTFGMGLVLGLGYGPVSLSFDMGFINIYSSEGKRAMEFVNGISNLRGNNFGFALHITPSFKLGKKQ